MPTLLSAGSNAQGQLGNATIDDSHVFQTCSFHGCQRGTLPPGTSKVTCVSSGANHTLVLLERNHDSHSLQPSIELWGCGSGIRGQLGPAFRSQTSFFQPIQLPLKQYGLDGYSYKAACASWETTYIVLGCQGRGDVLVSMGANDFGDLGVDSKGKGNENSHAIHIVSFDHLVVKGRRISSDSVLVKSISTGQHHVVVHLHATLTDASTQSLLVGWGTCRHGQLGTTATSVNKRLPVQTFIPVPKLILVNEPDSDVTGVSLGSQHTVILHASKHLTSLGSNRKGQLSGLQSLSNVHDIACTWNGTYVMVGKEAGGCYIFSGGSNSHGQLGHTEHKTGYHDSPIHAAVELPEWLPTSMVKRMVCGSEHVLLFTQKQNNQRLESEVWGWGWNEHGNLGLGTTTDVHIPIRIWPRTEEEQNSAYIVGGIWAGCGTSWLYLED
ncbi:hypothetical protein AMATHDRAFT_48393 [Amanita thiersii Skay4041]|uniref:Secretion-regulating guanine nucleotide exchange factor n=1 Tax=Amanita thiersii Skay4041 TaxID=703135 RepID=A0A2A9NKC9_9AGAR|nr:hypothetical protein AMATHDRAFT_48393 [Amanita thiersii Skay4041]